MWYWRRLLKVPWTARKSDQSILKEINHEYSLEGQMLKGREEKGMTENEMVGWCHGLNGLEFEQTLKDSEGRGGLAWCMGSQRVRHD